MKASILSFRAAVLMVLAGLIWGIVMGYHRRSFELFCPRAP
jgi:hypothetical protein